MTDAFAWLGGGSEAAGRAVIAWYAVIIGVIAIGQACVAAHRIGRPRSSTGRPGGENRPRRASMKGTGR